MSKIILTTFLLLAISTLIIADDFIYDSPYGGKKVGRIDERGYIYDDAYGGKKIGRVEDGKVYDDAYGGKKVGRIEENARCMMTHMVEKQWVDMKTGMSIMTITAEKQ